MLHQYFESGPNPFLQIIPRNMKYKITEKIIATRIATTTTIIIFIAFFGLNILHAIEIVIAGVINPAKNNISPIISKKSIVTRFVFAN